MNTDLQTVNHGLEGVVAAETRLSMVDGERGELVIGGFRVEELASWPFEDVVELLWSAAGSSGRPAIAVLPAHTETLLREAALRNVPAMDALRMAAGTLVADDDESAARMLVGTFPTIVAAYARLLNGEEPLAPRAELGIAANICTCSAGASRMRSWCGGWRRT